MERERLRWPIDQPAIKWIYKTANKNLWRVGTASYEIDDLIQDGFMCWTIVSKRYGHVSDRPHIMSLFQRTFLNHIHMLANKRSQELDLNQPIDIVSEYTITNSLKEQEQATFQVLCNQAPYPVKKILGVFASDDGLKRLRSQPLAKPGETKAPPKETLSEALCRASKMKRRSLYLKMLKEHFEAS